MEKEKNIYEVEWYDFIEELRSNERHYTYLWEKDWNKYVVKFLIWKNIGDFKKEIERNKSESNDNLSWVEIIEQWYNFFVSKYYESSVNTYLNENPDKADDLFDKILNWTSEISSKFDANKKSILKTKLRVFKYSVKILQKWFSESVSSILGENKKYGIDKTLVFNSFKDIFKYDPKELYINHSCLHLDHLLIDDENDKLIWIDWEHSVKDPYRYKFLDEAYIFQSLLHKQNEELAKKFLDKFLNKYKDEDLEHIKIIFTKKILWGIFEILNDLDHNKNYKEKIELHQKYLKEINNL